MLLLVACLAAFGCDRQDLLPGATRGKGDSDAFVLREMGKYGGTNSRPAGPVSGTPTSSALAPYLYLEDESGFQVVWEGNRVSAVCALLQQRFGAPAMARTNAAGLAGFVYSAPQTGLAVNCALDSTRIKGSTREVTRLVAVRVAR